MSALPRAAAGEVQVAALQIGFQSSGQPGRWLPLQISFTGLESGAVVQLRVTAPDPRGDLCESLCAEETVGPDGSVRLEGVFCTGRLEGSIRVELCDPAGVSVWQHEIDSVESTAALSVAAAPSQLVEAIPRRLLLHRQSSLTLLTIGEPAGISELDSQFRSELSTRDLLRVFRLPESEQLPSDPRGLDGVDVLLLTGSSTMSSVQGSAIREWVLAGGHLIVSCGEEVDGLLASPIGRWIQPKFGIPETANTLQTLDLSAIQNFVRGAVALQTNRNPVTVLRMSSRQPKVLAESLSDPLISRTSAGAGVITLTAVNLDSRPLDKWLSLPRLYEILLFGEVQSGRSEQTRSGGRIASVGITDLSTQLAAVADALPASERWSTWHVMLLMVVLLAFAGPIDYVIVVRLLKAPRLTWFTLPLLVAVGCLFAVQGASGPRSEFSARQIGLLDVFEDAGEQRLRARTWTSLSARDSRYARAATGDSEWIRTVTGESGEQSLIWSGRIENVYGGMYRPGGAGLGQLISRRSETASGNPEFSALPLPADGSTALLTDRRGTVANGQQLIESSLRLPASSLLEGSFTHHLPGPVTNWVVVCGNRIYAPSDRASEDVRELQPGEIWSREQGGMRVIEIRDFLRGVRLVTGTAGKTGETKSTVSQIQQSWDVNNRNPLDILLMMSLYESAGGRAFVQLRNDAFRKDELSDTIGLNHALLLGVTPEPPAELLIDGNAVSAAESSTIVRLFIPVQRLIDDQSPKMGDSGDGEAAE